MQRMDLHEWELLPHDGFIDLHEDRGSKIKVISPSSNTNSVIDMDYFQSFINPSQEKKVIINTRDVPVVPINKFDQDTTDEKEIPEDHQTSKDQQQNKAPKHLGVLGACGGGDDQETVSQVFFKKLKDNEFADMKLDSPKSLNKGFVPQVDVGTYQYEEKDGNFEDETPMIKKDQQGSKLNEDHEVTWHDDDDDHNGGLNIWKWAMTGIGAVCSFGFAAATVSLIVLGNRHKDQHNLNKNQELHFQIYSHEKRIKQVVHHAQKLNEAITAVRGAPLTRAHITIGGYYEGL